MKRDLRPLIMLVLVCLVGFYISSSVVAARAQEATPEPTYDVPTSPLPPAVYLQGGQVALDAISLVGIIVAAFVTGGVTISAGLGVLAGKLLKNKDALDAMERIAVNTIPTDLLVQGNKVIIDAEQWFKLLEKITDQKPNDIALLAVDASKSTGLSQVSPEQRE